MLTIQKNHIVSIDYTLTSSDGELIDTSKGGKPLTYLHGSGALIPGMEKALEGKADGETFKVSIAPDDAYGNRNENLVHTVDRAELAHLPDLEVGMELEVETDDRPLVLTIIELTETSATLDGNHPLADETLHFDVEVKKIREATPEELDHGHAHGPDGHQH